MNALHVGPVFMAARKLVARLHLLIVPAANDDDKQLAWVTK